MIRWLIRLTLLGWGLANWYLVVHLYQGMYGGLAQAVAQALPALP